MKLGVPTLVILDNLQTILTQTFSPTQVKKFVQQLKQLKEINRNLTILLIAHTPKRNMSKPITQNDLAGTKVLANFADSMFAISCSGVDPSVRYIKLIKSREVPHPEEVAVCEISDKPYLHLEFIEMGCEEDHLAKMGASRLSKVDDFIRERVFAMRSNEKSIRDIADELGLSKSTVHRICVGEA